MRTLGLSPTRDLRPSFGTLGGMVLVIFNVHITEVERLVSIGRVFSPSWQGRHGRKIFHNGRASIGGDRTWLGMPRTGLL